MKYFRHAHLVYAALFALCIVTGVLKLGMRPVSHIILASWLASAVGLMYRERWAWTGSLISMSLMLVVLLVNLVVAIGCQPSHSDWLKDIILLIVLNVLPVILGLVGLLRMRSECWMQKQGTEQMPTTA